MKKYPKKKIPFPILPGDTVFYVTKPDEGAGEPEIVAEVAHGIGIDDDDRLFVSRDGSFVFFGADDRCFFTEEDAKSFIDDPTTIDSDYGTFEYTSIELPIYPGDELFFPDYDPVFDRWQILVSICEQVLFNDDGSVDIFDNDGCEDRFIGETHRFGPPMFDTARKARNYVKKQGYGRWKL
jgi:hypothetical protein